MPSANPVESDTKTGTVHYQGITVQLRLIGMSPVLIEHRPGGDYNFDRDATAARNHVRNDLNKIENAKLSADGDIGAIGGTTCLFYRLLG
jgi:hypothetical protein